MTRIAFALGILAAAVALADLKEEIKNLQGNWSLVSTEADGNKPPPEVVEKFKMILTADKLTIRVGAKNVAASYKLLPDKMPKGIDLTALDGPQKGTTKAGIYLVDGDDLKLCFSKEGKPRPKEFTGKKGSEQMIMVLQREKDKEKK